jgi:hypothetical protein
MSKENTANNHIDEVYDALTPTQQENHIDAYELAWMAHSSLLDAIDNAIGMAGDLRDGINLHDPKLTTNKNYFQEDYQDYQTYRRAAELLMPLREAYGLDLKSEWRELEEDLPIEDLELGDTKYGTYYFLNALSINSVNGLIRHSEAQVVTLLGDYLNKELMIETIKEQLESRGLRLRTDAEAELASLSESEDE